MYNIKLADDEEIILISDNTIITTNEDKLYTSIITNKRFLVLDYPNAFHNSEEDLRSIGRINTVKMKEPIFETSLTNITEIKKEETYNQIFFNGGCLTIKDNEIITKLCDIIK